MLESDLRILRVLLDHGQLSTRQLALEVERSEASVRRRMRGFLVAEQLAVDLGRARVCDQKLYALGPRGLEVMAAERKTSVELLPVSSKPPRGYASVLQPHRSLVADVRIAAHRSSRRAGSPVLLRASFHDGHLSSLPARRRSKSRWDKFVLGWNLEDVLDPSERCGCVPDAMLVLCPAAQPGTQMSCFLEADRGTEQILDGPIWKKLHAYLAMWRGEVYRAVPERPALRPLGMRVLFVIAERTRWRIKAMRQALARFVAMASRLLGGSGEEATPLRQFAGVFRFALAPTLLEQGTDFFLSPVWETVEGEVVPLFRGNSQTAASAEPVGKETAE